MLFPLALVYLASQGVQALPAPISGIDRREPPSCEDINRCRTIGNILWSCLATVFSCTWVAIHPNIPYPGETATAIALRRVKLVLVALIAPELVIMWAMRERTIALQLEKKYRRKFLSSSDFAMA